MDKLAMFIPLIKADAAQRLVYGEFDETPDRAKEVFDYITSKPLIEAWSADKFEKSNGKSYGNVRGQHNGKIAAGKLVEITYDDELKKVGFVAKIVDDNEWQKVDEGVYTGFSPGGSYAKRWKDGAYNRYTADFAELSIVDVPCNSNAYFTMVKADGTEEEVEFVLDKAYEPGNEATKARAEEMAKAAGGSTFKDHVVQARADLIAENVTAALAKMAGDTVDGSAEAAQDDSTTAATVEAPQPIDALSAALAKADAAVAATHIDPVDIPSAEAEFAKGLDQIAEALADKPLIKGLRGICDLAMAIYQVVAVQASIAREANDEGDASTVPAQVTEGIRVLGEALIASAKEEVAELLTDLATDGLEEEVFDWTVYECAAPIIDLVKADASLMEKAGARNSKNDGARIQTIHDKAAELGACCTAEKVAGLAEENERLAKAVEGAAPAVERLTKTITDMQADRAADRAELAKMATEIDRLGAQPALTKVQLAHGKGEDGGKLSKAEDVAPKPYLERLAAASPAERRQMILGALPR